MERSRTAPLKFILSPNKFRKYLVIIYFLLAFYLQKTNKNTPKLLYNLQNHYYWDLKQMMQRVARCQVIWYDYHYGQHLYVIIMVCQNIKHSVSSTIRAQMGLSF